MMTATIGGATTISNMVINETEGLPSTAQKEESTRKDFITRNDSNTNMISGDGMDILATEGTVDSDESKAEPIIVDNPEESKIKIVNESQMDGASN
jgi:hypothetical protein